MGGNTFVVVPLPTVGDGARVEVVMTERICWGGQRQLSGPRLPQFVILSFSKETLLCLADEAQHQEKLEVLRLRSE